ncbi:MAG: NAD(P)/FAD-dependent oxidoreductase [Bacteroidota bacterium]
MHEEQIIIIGAGLAGLTAAYHLRQAGRDPLVLEASDDVGGRVRTDKVDGFILDRGFQILLTSYPECQAILDYERLDLRYFERGAEIYGGGRMMPFYDPGSGWSKLWQTFRHGPARWTDYTKLLRLRASLSAKRIPQIYQEPERSTIAYLHDRGFSEQLISTFWKPFYQGIFLENELETSSRLFEFTFKMFIDQGAAVPAKGMMEIPRQLASHMDANRIKFHHRVQHIENGLVHLHDREPISARHIIIATSGLHDRSAVDWKQVTNVYYTRPRQSESSRYVMLNANADRIVNNVAIMSAISGDYAPEDYDLISVSANGDHRHQLDRIDEDLTRLYGSETDQWARLQAKLISQALPDRSVIHEYHPEVAEGIYVAGDHQLEGSINGAMKSGRLAAEAVLG